MNTESADPLLKQAATRALAHLTRLHITVATSTLDAVRDLAQGEDEFTRELLIVCNVMQVVPADPRTSREMKEFRRSLDIDARFFASARLVNGPDWNNLKKATFKNLTSEDRDVALLLQVHAGFPPECIRRNAWSDHTNLPEVTVYQSSRLDLKAPTHLVFHRADATVTRRYSPQAQAQVDQAQPDHLHFDQEQSADVQAQLHAQQQSEQLRQQYELQLQQQQQQQHERQLQQQRQEYEQLQAQLEQRGAIISNPQRQFEAERDEAARERDEAARMLAEAARMLAKAASRVSDMMTMMQQQQGMHQLQQPPRVAQGTPPFHGQPIVHAHEQQLQQQHMQLAPPGYEPNRHQSSGDLVHLEQQLGQVQLPMTTSPGWSSSTPSSPLVPSPKAMLISSLSSSSQFLDPSCHGPAHSPFRGYGGSPSTSLSTSLSPSGSPLLPQLPFEDFRQHHHN